MKKIAWAFFLCTVASPLWGASLETQSMRARKGPPGMPMTAVYGELRNGGTKPIHIAKLETPVAGKASFHETMTVDGLSHMKPLATLTLAPGETVTFLPGAKHIMLEQLNPDWHTSGKLTLTFTFDDGSRQDVAVAIQENP